MLVDEPVAVADAFGGDQRALGIEAVEDVLESLPFLADQVLGRNFEIVEEKLVGLVIDHVDDRLHRHAVPDRLAQIDEEYRHSLGPLLHLVERRRPGEQDHEVRMQHARDPHLLPVDDVAVALPDGGRLDLGGVGARGRFGDAHRLQPQLARRDLRQIRALLRFRAVPQQRAHVVHLAVARARIAAGAVDLLHDDRGFGQPEPRAAVLLRDERCEPAGLRQRHDEGVGIAALFVDLAEIRRRKLRAEVANGVANVLMRFDCTGHAAASRGFTRQR